MATMTSKHTDTTVLDLPSAVTRLRKLAAGQFVLSAYLDTSPTRLHGQAFLLAYRDAVRAVRSKLVDAQSGPFEAAAARVKAYLAVDFTPRAHGLAVFAGGSFQSLVVVPLPQSPVLEHVTWDEHPEVGPLEAMLDECERVAVVLFDTEHARLFSVFLGGIESQQAFQDEVPAKQATGGWFGLQQTSFARHREDHLRRHAEHTVRMMMTMLRARSFDRLLIGGPDEPLAVLRRELPRPLRARLAGTLDLELFASDAEVLQATLRVAEAIERQNKQRLVDELLEAATTPHVVLGVTGTLDALAEGRIHLLLLADTFGEAGAQCSACRRLVRDTHHCPASGASTEPLGNLREAVVEQAHAQGARIEIVDGDAATRLTKHGGIGAWTRF